MKKSLMYFFAMTFVFVFAAGAVFAAKPEGTGNVRGFDNDPNATWLGEIKYLFNSQGYHFWFTPSESKGYYTAEHSYHNVYKYNLEDTTGWCGPVVIPNRAPYNKANTDGMSVYFKVWDDTAGVYACGSE